MSIHSKKVFLILIILLTATGALLFSQIRRASNIVVKQKNESLLSAGLFDIPITPSDQMLGNPGAPITIVEFVNLKNSKSKTLHSIFAPFVAKHLKDVRLVWKNIPVAGILSGDPTPLHQAAICAGEQKKFWPFVDAIIAKNASQSDLQSLAEATGLNVQLWQTCITANDGQQIASDMVVAGQLGISDAPAVFINNKRLNTNIDLDYAQMLGTFVQQ